MCKDIWNVVYGVWRLYYEQNTSSVIQLWYNCFKEGREDVNDDAHAGRPITSTTKENIEAIKKVIFDNHCYREVADDVGILCQTIFTENKTAIMPQSRFLPKVEDTGERKAFYYIWGDKRKIEIKNWVSEMFRG